MDVAESARTTCKLFFFPIDCPGKWASANTEKVKRTKIYLQNFRMLDFIHYTSTSDVLFIFA